MQNIIIIFSIVVLFSSCAFNKLTGKNQLSLLSEDEVIHSSDSMYRDYLMKHKVMNINGDNDVQMVQRVGKRIVQAVNKYYSEHNMQSQLNNYRWEYHLVQDSQVNAWCMPGGKIVVYTGILPMVKSEAELAVILGHEVSHALLDHGKQRMSESMLLNIGSLALSTAVANKSLRTQRNIELAYGIGTEVGLSLPFSRKHEYEADKYGLLWTAMAGYDPNEAITLWQRMNDKSGKDVPELLRTHPTEMNRIRALKDFMPEAMKLYKK
jgi:Zn-dependent protease with chaperone function